ncbi:MAG: branched-chain amino acid ABC transporter permease, partial [Dehalococcoidia bacterium]
METTFDVQMQVLVNGIILGMSYGLVAVGLTLVFGMMKMFNFAHGELYMLGAFVCYYCFHDWGIPYVATVIIAILVVGVAGGLMEKLFFARTRGQFHAPLVISLGLMYVISTTASLWFGADTKFVGSAVSGLYHFGDVVVSKERVLATFCSLAAFLVLYVFMMKTKMGMAFRATAEDSEAAHLQGVNIHGISTMSFVLAGALAGLAGAIMAPIFSVDPFIGEGIIMTAVVVVIIGGMGSVLGSLVGGLILGLIESFGAQHINQWANMLG